MIGKPGTLWILESAMSLLLCPIRFLTGQLASHRASSRPAAACCSLKSDHKSRRRTDQALTTGAYGLSVRQQAALGLRRATSTPASRLVTRRAWHRLCFQGQLRTRAVGVSSVDEL